MQPWVKDKEWYGNPSMGLESYHKRFKNPFNGRMTPVHVYGQGAEWHFVVRSGPNSDYSYNGMRPGCTTAQALMDRLDHPQFGDRLFF